MSKPRYGWWSYVKNMIHRYPALCDQHAAMLHMQTTPSYSGMNFGGGDGRGLENRVVCAMSRTETREYEAVAAAIRETTKRESGELRLRLIWLIYWDRSHTLSGAALAVNVSYRTARRWNGDFIRLVAGNFGLLD